MVLCLRLGYRLPGRKTIPDQISRDKNPYYKALEAADKKWTSSKLDLSDLEKLLADLLAEQLASVHDQGDWDRKEVAQSVGRSYATPCAVLESVVDSRQSIAGNSLIVRNQ